jgi:hypothetical protein
MIRQSGFALVDQVAPGRPVRVYVVAQAAAFAPVGTWAMVFRIWEAIW